MTDPNIWHLTADELRDYLTDITPTVGAASVEAHLLACHDCRTSMATARRSLQPIPSGTVRTEAMWNRIVDRVDRPRLAFRSSNPVLLVSVASPPLLVATVAVAVVLLAAVGVVAATYPHWSLSVQVALTPLAQVVAAVVAFQPRIEPAGQLAEATPLAGARLPLLRALVASVLALVSGLVASRFTSLPSDLVAVCTLPGLALTAIVLAIATRLDPTRVAAALVLGWATLVLEWTRRQRTVPTADSLRAVVGFGHVSGWVFVGVTVAAVAICFRRRNAMPAWRLR
jgi:hypothetical protein